MLYSDHGEILVTNQKPAASLFIDAANYHYALQSDGWQIDWQRFRDYFRKLYDIKRVFYYEGIITKGFYRDLHPQATLQEFCEAKEKKKAYFRVLKGLGFTVRTKPIGRLYDASSGQMKHKCNFDVELTIDALDTLGEYKVLLLASGDGDFARLVRYLKGKYKKTVVISHRDRTSHQLTRSTNQLIHLRDIQPYIGKV